MLEVIQNWTQVRFSEPGWLWLAVALVLLLPLWKRLRRSMSHTSTGLHKLRASAWPTTLCMIVLASFWLLFTGAMAQPKLTHQQMREYLETRDFVIGMDRSGSMFTADIDSGSLRAEIDEFEKNEKEQDKKLRELYPTLFPAPPEDPAKQPKIEAGKVQRFQLARFAAYKFLKSRPDGDRAAMFTFDDEPYWSWPLGKDVKVVMRKISELSRGSGGGTNFDGPVGPNGRKGAFQATLDQFDALGKAKTKVIIFVSDGDAGISAERHQYFVEQMTKEGSKIHIFAIVIGSQGQMTNSSTQSLRKLVEEVNPPNWKDAKGEPVDAVIWGGNGEALQKAWDRISELEKSTIELEAVEDSKPVQQPFIQLGGIMLGVFVGLCLIFRQSF